MWNRVIFAGWMVVALLIGVLFGAGLYQTWPANPDVIEDTEPSSGRPLEIEICSDAADHCNDSEDCVEDVFSRCLYHLGTPTMSDCHEECAGIMKELSDKNDACWDSFMNCQDVLDEVWREAL